MESSSAYTRCPSRLLVRPIPTMPLRFSTVTPIDDNELDFTDDRLVIEEAIRDFSPREREVIELRFVKGMTQIEIAKKLGISWCRFRVCCAARLRRFRTRSTLTE